MQTFVLIALMVGLIGGQVLSLPLVNGVRITALDLAVAVVLLYAAYRSRKKPIRQAQGMRFIPSLWGPILGFAAVAVVSLALTWTTVPAYVVGGGLLYIFRWISYAALYWVASSTLIAPGVWYMTLLYSGIGIAAIGLLQYIWYPDLRNLYYLGWDPHYQRLFSTLLDPNFTGITLVFTALMLLSPAQIRRHAVWRVIGFLMTFGALILTYSRSTLISLAVGLFCFGLFTKQKVLMLGVAAVIALVLVVLPHTGEGRDLLRTASSYARLDNAGRAGSLIAEKPVLGHGFNILRFVATERSWIDETITPSRAGAGLDTSVLFVGATTGVIGMLVYGWLLLKLFRLGVSGLSGKPGARVIAVSYISALTAVIVHSMFINSLFYPWVMVWMWVGTGALERQLRAGR